LITRALAIGLLNYAAIPLDAAAHGGSEGRADVIVVRLMLFTK
jgi:hypothetical protein